MLFSDNNLSQNKINIEVFNNIFYQVKGINALQGAISYIDTTVGSFMGNQSSISMNLFTKNIKLNKLDIPISKNFNMSKQQELTLLYKNIYNEINKEYIKKLTELGEKNRINVPINKLDIYIKQIKEKYEDDEDKITRNIISKFLSSSSYIAVQGRFGPSQWFVSNSKTYEYILSNLDTTNLTYDKNGYLQIGNISYIINDNIDNDIILTGRKNSIEQPGLHCFILTDENNNIIINEYLNYTNITDKVITIYFSIEEIGLHPENQFLKINTRTLSYYRYKKLQRIKELYDR